MFLWEYESDRDVLYHWILKQGTKLKKFFCPNKIKINMKNDLNEFFAEEK